MPAWLLPALLAAGGMGSSLWASSRRRSEFERMMRMMQYYQNPKNVLAETEGLYRGMLQSPMYLEGQQTMAGAGRIAQGALAGNMVGSGVSGGLNVMQKSMGEAMPGMLMNQLRSGMYNSALDKTQQNISARLGMASGIMGQPSGAENSLGSFLGALGPLLRDYFTSRSQRRSQPTGGRDAWGRTDAGPRDWAQDIWWARG